MLWLSLFEWHRAICLVDALISARSLFLPFGAVLLRGAFGLANGRQVSRTRTSTTGNVLLPSGSEPGGEILRNDSHLSAITV